ncbi:MAG TPA: hypothetical protein PKD18_04065 [Saprospiraceae bacterium]|nr:hypothetical protein [Saprospiraceae bacterium]
MGTTLADEYFLKAWSNYPFCAEDALEPLNYALSFDEEHAPSLCLMGRLQMEILKNFKTAKHYFECALLADSDYVETYKYYSLLLIWLGDLTNAERILKMGENKPGFSKLVAITRRASILENSGKVKEAILLLKTGRNLSNCSKTFDFFKDELIRLERKIKKPKKKKSVEKIQV